MSWKPRVGRNAAMKVIKDDLLRWTCERHATDCPLDKHLLRDKALELAGDHGMTDFKCSERWLTSFLKRYGLPLNFEESSGPVFNNYRSWIDIMRSVITRYKHKDLFHLDELVMYTDVSPVGISSTMLQDEPDSAKRATVLLCCNASGTEKLPLLICGSYPAVMTGKDHVYSHSEDASISDGLFGEWLTRLNDRMSSDDRKILLLLHRNRVNAFRALELTNVRHVFFPDDFPPSLRPLKRDVFHFVKMVYRSKYMEGIRVHGRRWNIENVVRGLVEAWRKVPRDLIIASFQRTSFRTDDCFLEIHCDAWEDLQTGVSFKKFVTFDDDLWAGASRKQRASTGKCCGYNLRNREIVRLVDDSAIDCQSQASGNLKETRVKRDDWKRKSSLKRSRDKAQSDENEEAKSAKTSDESTSKSDEDVAVPAKLSRIVDIQTSESAAQRSKSDEAHATRAIAYVTSRIDTDCDDAKIDETADNRDGSKSRRILSNQRSMVISSEVDGINGSDIASQQVFDDTFAVDLDTRESNTKLVPHAVPNDQIDSVDLSGNDGRSPQKSLKRRRSRSANADESPSDSNDGEPKRKRSRSDSDWTKQYETTFVFGSSDLARTVSTVTADTLSSDEAQYRRPRRSCETERSIFTIRPRKE